MTTLKEITFIVTPFVVTCALMYLIGAFISASLNPQDWTWTARMLTAVWGMTFGFMLLVRLYKGRE